MPPLMLPLSSDSSFHYEFLRVLAATATHGSDVAELLSIAPRLIPGDFETWYVEFEQLAQSVLSSLDPKNSYDKIALRNAYFRASHYFFASDFYLHGNPEDARIQSAYEQWSTLFDKAIALLPFPGERRHVQASGFKVPIIILRPDASSQPRPTLILGNGFDGAMEEMYHVLGAPALERGYNVVLYEGPGQTGVRRTQKIGFRHDWETVVIPVVDLLETLDFVDSKKIVLMGYSMGAIWLLAPQHLSIDLPRAFSSTQCGMCWRPSAEQYRRRSSTTMQATQRHAPRRSKKLLRKVQINDGYVSILSGPS